MTHERILIATTAFRVWQGLVEVGDVRAACLKAAFIETEAADGVEPDCSERERRAYRCWVAARLMSEAA